MTDLSEFSGAATAYHKRGCSLKHIELSEERQAKLEAAMDSPDITGEAIARVLKSWGYSVSGNTVTRHRRGICSCD